MWDKLSAFESNIDSLSGNWLEKHQSPSCLGNVLPALEEAAPSGLGTDADADADNKLDYVMLSPPLWDRVRHVDVERRGIFVNGGSHSEAVTSQFDAASDHGALYADLDL